MAGLWDKIRLAKVASRYSGDFCRDCRDKFSNFVKISGDDTKVSAFDEVCDNCKPIVEKIYKRYKRGVFR